MRVYRLLLVVFACLAFSGCAVRGVVWGPPPLSGYDEGGVGYTLVCRTGPLWQSWCSSPVPVGARRTALPPLLQVPPKQKTP
jgi:hypothetical protein